MLPPNTLATSDRVNPFAWSPSAQSVTCELLDALAANDTDCACQALQTLINAVTAQSGKKLTVAQAEAVIAEAMRIRGLIGC